MTFQKAKPEEFPRIRAFYWHLIDEMQGQNDKIGWKKGIYPTDDFLRGSLARGELFTLTENDALCACVILSADCNDGYAGVPWSLDCRADEVLIPHALGVSPEWQGRGIGARVVEEILRLAKAQGRKAVRLDILGANDTAERLYTRCGFRFVQAKNMFYEDTGWTEYRMFERNL